jgi:DNA-binding MarR family transcriptional regulator
MSLGSEIKKRRPFDLAEEEAFLNVIRTADVLQREFAVLFRRFDLSETQYNALRILRGARAAEADDGGLPCGEIANRMVTRDPDVTRLLDRLEKRGLIKRCRDEQDRRVVCAHITPAALKLLAELDPLVADVHRRQLGHLDAGELKTLSALLEKAREGKKS